MSTRTLLSEEIQNEFGELKKMEVGSDEYKAAVDGLTKLVDRQIEMEKIEAERKDRIDAMENENYYRDAQLAEEKKDRFARNFIGAAGIIIPAALTIWGTKKAIEFEKEGTFTTIMGRGFIQKLLPKK